MNKIYAVDPGAPNGYKELVSLMRLFGPTEGRFIYELPSSWADHALKALADAPDFGRKRASEILKRRCKAFIKVSCPAKEGRSWLDSAKHLKPCAGVLMAERSCSGVISIDEALYSVGRLSSGRGSHVPRTADALTDVSGIILKISPHIVLVDRYLFLLVENGWPEHDRYAPVLRKIVKLASESGVEIFDVYTSARRLEKNHGVERSKFEMCLARLQEDVGATNIQLSARFLEDLPRRADAVRQHGRYLLGVGCGMQFDHGFDVDLRGGFNHVHWLDYEELEPLLERYKLPSY